MDSAAPNVDLDIAVEVGDVEQLLNVVGGDVAFVVGSALGRDIRPRGDAGLLCAEPWGLVDVGHFFFLGFFFARALLTGCWRCGLTGSATMVVPDSGDSSMMPLR